MNKKIEKHEKGWELLFPHAQSKSARKIEQYAEQYLEPALARFPELFGKVHLAMSKFGWLADYHPVLHIVVRNGALDTCSEWHIRMATAHELVHLVQFLNGVGLEKGDAVEVERQATFLTFARGYAYDLLRAFPEACVREVCDHRHRLCYYGCRLLFGNCCHDYSDGELRDKASVLEALAQGYSVHDHPDYFALVQNAMLRT